MAVPFQLVGGGHNREATIVRHVGESRGLTHPPGLMVYNHDFLERTNQPLFAQNETYGLSLNQNVSYGGTPDGMHNGTDNTYWTASALSGTWDFASTVQAQAGTKSIDATATTNNNQALLTRSSALTHGSYSALTGFVYLTRWPSSGTKGVNLQFRLAGLAVGNIVDLGDYIDTTVLNSWQAFAIDLSTFALTGTTVDEFTITTIDVGGGKPPNYYIDELKLQETGGSIVFEVKPPAGMIYQLFGLSYTMVDTTSVINDVRTVAGATENSSALGLSYNKFGGLSQLANGILLQRVINHKIVFSSVFRNNFNLLRQPTTTITDFMSDGTNTLLKINTTFAGPVEMNGNINDRFEIIIRDDLSGFLEFNISSPAVKIVPVIVD